MLNKLNILIILTLLISSVLPVSAESIPNLFYNEDIPLSTTARQRQDAKSANKVSVDFSLINPEGRRALQISAKLPDKSIILEMKKIIPSENGNYSWFGKVKGEEYSSVVFTVADGYMFGEINADGESYSIEPAGRSYKIIKENSKKMIPICGTPLLPPKSSTGKNKQSSRKSYRDSGNNIDVLVLYTSAIKKKYTSKLKSLIQHYADIANQAYDNSNINLNLRIVAVEPFYDDGTNENNKITDALEFITNNLVIKSTRKKYKADLVCLVRKFKHKKSSPCGNAWLMRSADKSFSVWAYSVVEIKKRNGRGYYCDKRTFAHEIGHNLGCAHDRPHASGPGIYDYSYGYKKKGKFTTIMSYGSHIITYFSTPLEEYKNKPIGKDIYERKPSYNALTIEQTKETVANFKKSGN